MLSTESIKKVGQLIATGQLDEAERICRNALADGAPDVISYINLGHIAYQKRSFKEAIEFLNAALALDPDSSPALYNLGVVNDQSGDLDAAERYYRRAISADPQNIAPCRNLASLLLDSGRLDESRATYTTLIERTPFDVDAHFAYSRLTNYSDDDPTLPALLALTARGRKLDTEDQVKLAFTVGTANQDLGRYRDAFKAFQRGNALHYRMHPYAEAQNYALLDDVRTVVGAEFIARHGPHGLPDRLPIFVLGMTRSGSTLVERMLSAHPDVAAGGELDYLKSAIGRVLISNHETIGKAEPAWTTERMQACAGTYLEQLDAHAGSAARVVDKMPGNFAFAGLIAALLPNARIVHTVRHPLATVWSNYTTHFAGGLNHTYDLDVLSRFYQQYQATMKHWTSTLPPGRMFELRYESLVSDPEPLLRELLDFLELPWDPACLDFHATSGEVRTASLAQVRRPLYTTAVDMWRNYAGELAPIRAALLKD
jgi:hypothetical protein